MNHGCSGNGSNPKADRFAGFSLHTSGGVCLRRAERIAAMMERLLQQQGQLISLQSFCLEFQVAKSTVSEDLAIIRRALDEAGQGRIETVLGAAGGVRYLSFSNRSAALQDAKALMELLRQPDRILAGGFIYMTDIVFSPEWSYRVGRIFASRFHDRHPEYVVTVETKGIPAALMTAHCLGVPLVVLRRDSRVTEGSTVSLNYISGSSQRRIQTMALPRRALTPGARALVIDDFMRGGGTAKGMVDLLHEVGVEVVGMGMFMATAEPAQKRVENYDPIFILESVSEKERKINLTLGNWLLTDQQQGAGT